MKSNNTAEVRICASALRFLFSCCQWRHLQQELTGHWAQTEVQSGIMPQRRWKRSGCFHGSLSVSWDSLQNHDTTQPAALTSFHVIWQAAKTLRLKQQFLLGTMWNPLYPRVIPWLWLISARRVCCQIWRYERVEALNQMPSHTLHLPLGLAAALQDCWCQRGSFSSSKLNFPPAMRAPSARSLLSTGNVIMRLTWFVTGLIHPTRTEYKTLPQTIFHMFFTEMTTWNVMHWKGRMHYMTELIAKNVAKVLYLLATICMFGNWRGGLHKVKTSHSGGSTSRSMENRSLMQ